MLAHPGPGWFGGSRAAALDVQVACAGSAGGHTEPGAGMAVGPFRQSRVRSRFIPSCGNFFHFPRHYSAAADGGLPGQRLLAASARLPAWLAGWLPACLSDCVSSSTSTQPVRNELGHDDYKSVFLLPYLCTPVLRVC